MTCASCGRTNREGARFCGGCGASLAPRCPACGAAGEAGARFCDACGASLVAHPTDAAVERKVVTIVFADLIGSMSLHERLDPESVARLMDRYHRAVRAPIEAHGGTVVQLLGDGVMCAFGVPRVAEDDAVRAVRAALDIQQAFLEFVREQGEMPCKIGLRVAVNTGEVVTSDDYTAGIGDPLNVAARLQQEARDGDVLIGESTQRLVAGRVTLAPVGCFALKGRAEPVAAFRVVSLDRPAGAAAVAFVGRDDELRRITVVYDTAVVTPATRLAVLLGSPGLGKSRLLAEFARRLGERATVLTAQCDAAGGATFAPLAEALRAHLGAEASSRADALRAGIDATVPGEDAERARIAAGIGALLAGTPASPEETFFVVRRLLAALAAARPVVLAIDDLQFAEPLLLDLVEHLVQWGVGVPLLVLAAARPELRDTRSSLAAPGGLVSDVVTLAGLDAGAATRLAASVIGADALPAAVAGRVLATSEGNPLFLGELVRMLVNDGVLRREGDRWTTAVELADLEMPPTIQALLAARIERLRPEERGVLERASVVGRQFSRAAVAHLLPRDAQADLDARLESLRRSELIEPDTGWLLGEPALRFHHVLIRDAAYRRLLRNTRAELHGRFADWLVSRVGESVEHDETIGWHLEQAHQHLRELGPLDASGRALGERAARYLAAAGRRALARDDLPPAASLLGRALDRLDAEDLGRADLALDWCEALLAAGDVGPAARALAELGRFTGDSERLHAWHTCFAGELAVLADPQALRATTDAVAAAAQTLTSAGDGVGEAKAHAVHALALRHLGKIGACEAALDRALAAARRVGDRRRSNAVLAGAPLAALWGPSPVTRASGRCLDVVRVLRITQGSPAVEAVALRCQAVLETLRGRTDAARRMIASSRRMVEELGITQRVLEADVFAGLIELYEGDAVAAERWLRAAYAGLRERGLGIDAAQAAALLGRALLAQGRVADAEVMSQESEALAGDDFKAAIAWRGVRAEALASRGEHAAAVELARAAVDIAAATDDLLDHADARQALAVALRSAGRNAEADAETQRAIELWEAKGATLLAERARRGTGDVARPETAADEPTAVRRRVRPNAATANAARAEGLIAARDVAALATLQAEDLETVDHPSGAVYDKQGTLTTWRSLFRARDPAYRHEPLATLGDALALCRQWISTSGLTRGKFDVGAHEREDAYLIEVDADGRRRRAEYFAPDRLGDAIGRLYERYAELLPDGAERTRAAATARAVAAMPLAGAVDLDRYVTVLAPDVDLIDHRTVGPGALHGPQAVIQGLRSLLDLTADFTNRVDDILRLRSDALLVRRATFGTDRASGGAFERQLVLLAVFGIDGLLTRIELFDVVHEDDALARFDELTTPRVSRRRVRANAATAYIARVDSALVSRDLDAIANLYADELAVLHHPTGVAYDREANLASLRLLLSARELHFHHEPVATLGDSLALLHDWSSFSGGYASDDLALFGTVERERIDLVEVDAIGRQTLAEFFATDRLGDAIARLYARYAELLPDGPDRARAEATARTVAAMLAERPDPNRWAAVFDPAIDWVDDRLIGLGVVHGSEAVMRAIRTLLELADDFSTRIEDVLELRPDGLLLRWTNFGTDRASGAAFERPLWHLWRFGADGLLTRWEQFDGDRNAEALARFDALVAPRSATRVRRVRPNAATANVARMDAAAAARDLDAFTAVLAEGSQIVHHPTRMVYEDRGSFYRQLLRDTEDLRFGHEVIATLGDSLALSRSSLSFTGRTMQGVALGAANMDSVVLTEVDARGQRVRTEFFALDRLGDAVARLYERYAELVPEGPARVRAAATARAVATVLGPPDVARFSAALGPGVEFADRRTLGFGAVRGARALLEGRRGLLEISADVANHVDDLLAARPDALLVRLTTSGTDRTGGGGYEKHLLVLWVFGSDGLLTRLEQFDVDRDAEALARFDELAVSKPERRVRPNAATVNAARLDAAIASLDADALPSLYAHSSEGLEHPTGATFDRMELLASWRSLLSARDPTFQTEPLATLGDSLALCRQSMSGRGFAGRTFDVGAYEREDIALIEVDAHGRRRRTEAFASDRLGDAVVRLYERYAELLPEGPARDRAATTARSAMAMHEPPNLDHLARAFAPSVEARDERSLGTWSARGAEATLQHFRSLLEVADDIVMREYEILRLEPDALLVRRTHRGTERAGGGTYERRFLMLLVFGAEGQMTRVEWFDPDRDAEALARFDELTAEAPAMRFANAAARCLEHTQRCWRARDWDGVVATYDPTHRMDDRRKLMRVQISGADFIANERMLFDETASQWQSDLLATRGERLALCRVRFSAEALGSGPMAVEMLDLVEVDAAGRRIALVVFDPDDLDAAYAELDDRYTTEAPGFAAFRVFSRTQAARDWDAVAALLAPDVILIDRRLLGWQTLQGREAFVRMIRSLFELAPDAGIRVDHATESGRAQLLVVSSVGTRDGGAFEIPRIAVVEGDAQDHLLRMEQYDLDQLELARARFAELAAPRTTLYVENAAAQTHARLASAIAARDREGIARVYATGFRLNDRRTLVSVDLDRDQQIANVAGMALMSVSRVTHAPLATRGERLVLEHAHWEGAGPGQGPSVVEWLEVSEVNRDGAYVAQVMFDPDDLDSSYAELDTRYGNPVMAAMLRDIHAREWDAVAARLAPDLVVEDHRLLGWETLRGPAAYLDSLRALVELAPDARLRADHLEQSDRAALAIVTLLGTREGGAFETPRVVVAEFDARDRVRLFDFYDLDRLDLARARFAELASDPLRIPPNAAVQVRARVDQAWEAGDWAALRALASDGFVFDDRRRRTQLSGGVDLWLESMQAIRQPGVRFVRSLLATLGERISIQRSVWSGTAEGSPFELEQIVVTEIDAAGRIAASINFDADDRAVAFAEAHARFVDGEAGASRAQRLLYEFTRALARRDWDAAREYMAPDATVCDHRTLSLPTLGRDDYIASLRAVDDLTPDMTVEPFRLFAWSDRGSVYAMRRFGTLGDGGAFESVAVGVAVVEGDRVRRVEFFELAEAERAIARFEELCEP